MDVAVGFFHSQEGLFLAVLVGSLVVIKLLKLSSAIAVAAATIPLAVYCIDVPLVSQLRSDYPAVAVGGAWLSTAILGLLWRGLSPICAGFSGSVGVLRFAYLTGLAAALVVVGVLFIDPDLLAQHVPAWRSTLGGTLLVVTLVGVSRALAQIVKAGALLAVWSGVAVVLASQVFLHKMPQAIEPADITRLEGLFASASARRALHGVHEALQGRYSLSRLLGGLKPVLPEMQGVAATASQGFLLHMTEFAVGQEAEVITGHSASREIAEAGEQGV
jgi:hypothetical protein